MDVSPTPAADAFLVADPQFAPDITFLDRNNVRQTLSKDSPIAGRKLAKVTFTHEVRSNGNTAGTTAPRLGRLLEACGMVETARTLPATCIRKTQYGLTNVVTNSTFACTVGMTQPIRRRLTITVTNATGPVCSITAPAEGNLPAINMVTQTMTTAVAKAVVDTAATAIATITPTWVTAPSLNDVFFVDLEPIGYVYTPTSGAVESLTLYLYLPDDSGNSILHIMTGARGTWTMTAQGGNFATFQFSFTGSYVPVTGPTTPTGVVYETQKPPQVELAGMKVFGADHVPVTTLKAAQYTLDIANDVQIREDVNAGDAYAGAMIVDRKPAMGMDPETVLESTFGFWANLVSAQSLEWSARVGTVRGNTVIFSSENINTNGLAYANRASIRTYDFKAACSAVSSAGDDELSITFC